MKKLSSYLVNTNPPAAGFSEGTLKDDPGDGTGSGATVQTANDWYYAILALAKKYLPGGSISDTDESETASDNMNAIELAIGIKNENVSEYDNTSTYAQDAHVIYLGLQFVSMVASNTGNNPVDNPDKWLPCFNREDVFIKWQKGDDIKGGFDILHNFRDAGYRQFFQWGKFNIGGDSGRNFQATGLHLDGTIVTGNTVLENLLDVGGANEYHLLDVIAPDDGGTRTLIDSRGRVGRAVDAVAGDTEDVGSEQEDAFQGHKQQFEAGVNAAASVVGSGCTGPSLAGQEWQGSSGVSKNRALTGDFHTDGINGTPRTGSETTMKNYTVGVTSILIIQEI